MTRCICESWAKLPLHQTKVIVALTLSVSLDISRELKRKRNSCLSNQDCIRAPAFAEQAIQSSHGWLGLRELRLLRLQGALSKPGKYLKSRETYMVRQREIAVLQDSGSSPNLRRFFCIVLWSNDAFSMLFIMFFFKEHSLVTNMTTNLTIHFLTLCNKWNNNNNNEKKIKNISFEGMLLAKICSHINWHHWISWRCSGESGPAHIKIGHKL